MKPFGTMEGALQAEGSATISLGQHINQRRASRNPLPATWGAGCPTSPGTPTGYNVRLVGGDPDIIGGTSAVAPLWAGLIALMNEGLSKQGKPPVGLINPILYQLPAASSSFHDIVNGNNDLEGLGKYAARPSWDPCTGLGSPDGKALAAAIGV